MVIVETVALELVFSNFQLYRAIEQSVGSRWISGAWFAISVDCNTFRVLALERPMYTHNDIDFSGTHLPRMSLLDQNSGLSINQTLWGDIASQCDSMTKKKTCALWREYLRHILLLTQTMIARMLALMTSRSRFFLFLFIFIMRFESKLTPKTIWGNERAFILPRSLVFDVSFERL